MLKCTISGPTRKGELARNRYLAAHPELVQRDEGVEDSYSPEESQPHAEIPAYPTGTSAENASSGHEGVETQDEETAREAGDTVLGAVGVKDPAEQDGLSEGESENTSAEQLEKELDAAEKELNELLERQNELQRSLLEVEAAANRMQSKIMRLSIEMAVAKKN